MDVGLIGVGIMGSRIAGALIDGGHPVVARDIDPAAEARAREIGCTVVESPAAVAASADVVLLSLPMPEDVEEVVCREDDGVLAAARPGAVVVDLSTVDAFSTQRNAALAAEKGVGYLDCPVLGRPQKVSNWTLPTGGDPGDVEKARPALECVARVIMHVGPSGHGNIIKLLNNMMFGAINAITAEIFAVCRALDMEPRVLFDTIAGSGAATVSNLFQELGPKLLEADYTPLFSVDNLHKDMRLGIEMARRAGAGFLVSEANQQLVTMARDDGLGSEDTAAVIKVYERLMSS